MPALHGVRRDPEDFDRQAAKVQAARGGEGCLKRDPGKACSGLSEKITRKQRPQARWRFHLIPWRFGFATFRGSIRGSYERKEQRRPLRPPLGHCLVLPLRARTNKTNALPPGAAGANEQKRIKTLKN
jgi:hypothetical protein